MRKPIVLIAFLLALLIPSKLKADDSYFRLQKPVECLKGKEDVEEFINNMIDDGMKRIVAGIPASPGGTAIDIYVSADNNAFVAFEYPVPWDDAHPVFCVIGDGFNENYKPKPTTKG